MQRYFAINKNKNILTLEENDLKHIKTVMRMHDNDEIEVVYDNKLYLCCIEDVNKNMVIKIKKEIDINEKKLGVTLIIPILKENKMDYIFQKATELGVDNILLVQTERTLIKLDEKGFNNKYKRWTKIVKEACEQSKRIKMPVIKNFGSLKDLSKMEGINILCSTSTTNNIRNYFQNITKYDKINIVIGPEGGFSSSEEKYLNKKGFESVSLGKRILRVETVPLFVLSIINYINME